jgi:glycine/D-amino acid oxidase-like deaminating enzyme
MYPHYPAHGSRRCFNAMVTALDESVGVSPNSRRIEAPWLVNGGHGASFRLPFGSQVIVSALRAAQLYSNSIIVYSSDNVKKSACPPGCRGSI